MMCQWSLLDVDPMEVFSVTEDYAVAYDLLELWMTCFQTDIVMIGPPKNRSFYKLSDAQASHLLQMSSDLNAMAVALHKRSKIDQTNKSVSFFESSFWAHCMNALTHEIQGQSITASHLAHLTQLVFAGFSRSMPTQFLTSLVHVQHVCREICEEVIRNPSQISSVGFYASQLRDHCMTIMHSMMTDTLEQVQERITELQHQSIHNEDPHLYELLDAFMFQTLQDEARLAIASI